MRTACLLALALASGTAAALGLGQIRVLSAPGQPFVAEIPVVSSDPSELVELRAGLASPETFTRIGLQPPVGVVADLRFVVATDASGRPVIRITSGQPVTEPLLTFLVEVDWGQGRLVREYSALVAAPNAVAAAPAVPVQTPQVQAPAVVERPQAAPAPAAPALPERTVSTAPAQPAPVQQAPAPVAASESPAGAAGDAVRVRAGDTLSRIAARVAPEDVSAEQTMVGLLRANPQAFVGGDMNQLRRGSVLRVPAAAELEAIEAREAADLVRSYARQWRQARSQPQAAAAEPAPRAAAAVPRAAPAPAAGGRLEIVPPGAGRAAQAGTQSGIAAGGEGEMLRQELQTTRETLAARDAELQELKGRVAELERLQADQRKLIALKDAELNAAQQRTGAAPADRVAEPAGSSALPWLGGGALLLIGLGLVAWLRRRRTPRPAVDAPARPRPSVADAYAPAGATLADAKAVEPAPVAPAAAAASVAPSWERGAGRRAAKPSPATVAATAAPAAAPAWAAGEASPSLEPQVEPANAERLELAQAYLDMGDTERARQLLGEVEASGDATASSVASRMRQGLG